MTTFVLHFIFKLSMKIVLSPAKSLDFESTVPFNDFSESSFIKESKRINKVLLQNSANDLSVLLSISDKLAELNWQRNKSWKTPFTTTNSRQAIYAFSGDVYVGLDAKTLNADKMNKLQEQVRILSGLYGLLKPLDLIQPYRLEMGTKISIGNSNTLYEFWKNKITVALNKELKSGELFLNLASIEYFSVIDTKTLKVPVYTPVFMDYKEGKLKIISFFAKKARGLMVRYIMDTSADSIEDLKGFNYEGYRFDTNLSKGNNLIFTR